MRLATIVTGLAFVCGCSSGPVGPTNGGHGAESTGGAPLPRRGGTEPAVIAVYTATLTASPTCAFVLESEARGRTYTQSLRSDGSIDWSAPTLDPPSGHTTISSGVLSHNVLSFSVDVERDPQPDDFHGLWENLGSGKVLNISGNGSGVIRDGEVTGTFDGLFALYDPLDPPQPGILFTGHYCKAKDHQFRFVRQ